mgnify:CR=1 FL=1
MDLRDIDLNLLVVFRQLMIERRVSRAAESLGLTQPAVSNALARLRKALNARGVQVVLFSSPPRGSIRFRSPERSSCRCPDGPAGRTNRACATQRQRAR